MEPQDKAQSKALLMAYYREPPFVRFLDHFLIFMTYAMLSVAGWIVYNKAVDGFRPDFFTYTLALTITCGIASLGALLDHYRFEFAMLPFISALLFIYALSLLTLPDDSQGAFFIMASGFASSRRLLHLSQVAQKGRKTKILENVHEGRKWKKRIVFLRR